MDNASVYKEVKEIVLSAQREVIFLRESSDRTSIINEEYMELIYLRSEMSCAIPPSEGIILHRRMHPTDMYRCQPEEWERCAKEFAD